MRAESRRSFMPAECRRSLNQNRLWFQRTTFLLNVLFKFCAEVFDKSFGWHCRCIGSNTNRSCFHVFTSIQHRIEIGHASFAFFHSMQNLIKPVSSFPALRTLS